MTKERLSLTAALRMKRSTWYFRTDSWMPELCEIVYARWALGARSSNSDFANAGA